MRHLSVQLVIEASLWLSTESSRQSHFRSPALQPADEFLRNPLGYASSHGDEAVALAVQRLCRNRRALVDLEPALRTRPTPDQVGGRILLCSIMESVMDGASAASSADWFDINDLPPWDTWLAYGALFPDRAPYTDVLVAYVPPEALHCAESGILVNPVDCLSWARDSDALFELLQQARSNPAE